MNRCYLFRFALVSALMFSYYGSHAQTYLLNASTNGTTVSTCSGTFYDSGGNGGNYTNNENYTITFSSSSGNCIQLNFTAFRTQGGNDYLYLYDGTSVAAPLIGNFSGTTSPGSVSAMSGSITIRFVSNGSNTRSGWAASISCVSCSGNYNMTNGAVTNTCAGIFYDSGGPSGNYTNNENRVHTFCSNGGAGSCLQVVFTAFNTQSNRDTLTVFDGPNTSSVRIGVYSGTTLPPTLVSSTGCLTFRFVSNSSTVRAGWSAIISCVNCPTPPSGSATYIHPVTGIGGYYVGASMVNTCGGTYADNGGTGSNYSTNINNIYRTFCPNTPGTALRVQFYSFSTESGYDGLSILNGATQNSPEFGTGSTFSGTCTSYQNCMAAGLGPFVSTDQSGCLTFRFSSDFSITYPGWVATFDCVPYAAGPNGTDNNDCQQSTGICSNQSFSDASTGPGLSSDVSSGCIPTENYSNWYTITIASSGTLGFNLAPAVNTDDYDFALYGPTSGCGSLGSPVRCSFAANLSSSPSTGMNSALNISTNTNSCGFNNSGSDNSEDACGNGWTNELNVTTGQTYMLCVNKWSPGGSGFFLSWLLSGGASLDCSVVPTPIELLNFTAVSDNTQVNLAWTTATEINNNYFTVEKSRDGRNFTPVVSVPGAGNSTFSLSYKAVDEEPYQGVSYYRLKQTDYDGKYTYSDLVPIKFESQAGLVVLNPNPAHDDLSVIVYSQDHVPGIITIISSQGQKVFETSKELEKGINRISVDLTGMAKGVYFVTLEIGTDIRKARLVKD